METALGDGRAAGRRSARTAPARQPDACLRRTSLEVNRAPLNATSLGEPSKWKVSLWATAERKYFVVSRTFSVSWQL